MTRRKPPGQSFESWIDQVIREGREQGEFDDLPGHGKPIADLGKAYDEMWWVRKKLSAEGISYLPPTLALRKDREDTLAGLDRERTEARVRLLLGELNDRIRAVNRRPGEGPPSTVMPVDIDEQVALWADRRAVRLAAEAKVREERTASDTAAATARRSGAGRRKGGSGRRWGRHQKQS